MSNSVFLKTYADLPAVSVESILEHPRNKERQKLFEPIKDWEYIHV